MSATTRPVICGASLTTTLALTLSGCLSTATEEVDTGFDDSDASVGVVQEALSGGIDDLNDPIRNATVLFGNGCSGTLIRDDMVLGCGHCAVLAAAWNTPGVTRALANDWRALGDWQQQTVTITFDRYAPICAGGDAPTDCRFVAHAIAASEGGSVDQLLFLLDRPVPGRQAVPSVVMSQARYSAIGGLAGRSLRPAGWGLVAGGAIPRYRQTIPLNTAARLNSIDADPNAMWVDMPAGVSMQGGDSGGGLYWWDPGEARQYVVADLQSTGSSARYFATFADVPGPWNGADALPGTPDDIPATLVSTWIQQRLADGARARFSPAVPDRWHSMFCAAPGGTDVCTTGDFDGDGDGDLVRFTRNGTGVALGTVQVGASRRWRSWKPEDGDTGFAVSTWATDFAGAGENVEVGDVDGDGRDDIVAFERTGATRVLVRTSMANESWSGYGNPTSTSFAATVVARSRDPLCQESSTSCEFASLTGSSADDLIEVNGSTGNVRVLVASGVGSALRLAPVMRYRLDGACPSASCRPAIGDLDADGLDDLVLLPVSGSTIRARLNTGSNWGPLQTWTNSSVCSGAGARCRLADVDGDLRADLVAFGSGGAVGVRRRMNTDGEEESIWHRALCPSTYRACELADVNGDGLADAVGIAGSGAVGAPTGQVFVGISLLPRDPFFVNPSTGLP